MNWSSWWEFFAMGGYAGYVWSSFGVTFLLLALELNQIVRARKQAIEWVQANTDPALPQ